MKNSQTHHHADAACCAPAITPQVEPEHAHACCEPHVAPVDAPSPTGARNASMFRISDMDCSAEESQIRRALEPVAGIRSLGFQLGARTLTIDAPAPVLAEALAAVRKIGFDPQPVAMPAAGADALHSHGGANTGLWKLGVALLLAVFAELIGFYGGEGMPAMVAEAALALGAIALAGFDTYRKGMGALRRGQLNINALMSVAVTGAFAIGQWPEAAMVMTLYAIAELIEARSVDRARNAIQKLMALAPEAAEVEQADGSWRVVPCADVAIGASVRIKPGERVPMDGVVTAGQSAINQAPVTGESIPVDKTVGDRVFAGTINENGALIFRVSAVASDTTLARIVHSVEQAQGTRAHTQRLVDRFAAVYTPAVFAIALAVLLLAPWLMGWTWLEAGYKALVLLVIACPCALVIATPVTVVSALAAAARQGILIKGGRYLEDARKLKVVAFDKTGTITSGKPKLVDTQTMGSPSDDDKVRGVAASLAARSNHPVSRAIADGLGAIGGTVDDFKAMPGLGTEGVVEGRRYVLGNRRLLAMQIGGEITTEESNSHEAAGHTVTWLAADGVVLAWFAVADTVKPGARAAVADLHALGLVTVMLSGDNAHTVRAVAQEASIDDAQGDLLPEGKRAAIEALEARHGLTAMAGDGINDAPALAQAGIGIAMGAAGTDVAMEAADVVIMNDDLNRIATTIRLSRKTHAVLWQNILLALGIKGVFLVMAVFGNATMWMAVFADMGASLLVVANGLRLLHAPAAMDRSAAEPER